MMIKVKCGWLFKTVHFYVRGAPFKLTATTYMEHYSELLFLVKGLKNPCLSFLRFLSLVQSQIQTHTYLDGAKAGYEIQGGQRSDL